MPETKSTFTIAHNGETWVKEIPEDIVEYFMEGQGFDVPKMGKNLVLPVISIGAQNKAKAEADALAEE